MAYKVNETKMITKLISLRLPKIESAMKMGNIVSINLGTLIINEVDVTMSQVNNAYKL